MDHQDYLVLAIEEATSGMRSGEGGPFGALIVRDGEILGRGHNTVLASHDPTAHAEMNTIRDACAKVGDHHLTGAVIYTNFEPCPMCLSAIYWADIRAIYFSAGREQAGRAGFMDGQLYKEVSMSPGSRRIPSTRIPLEEMAGLMDEWEGMEGRITY